MKYLKKFNEELKKSTYISAAKKLSELGGIHNDRAKNLKDFAKEHGEEIDIHNLHYHEFTLKGSWNGGYKVDDYGYIINDYKIEHQDDDNVYFTVFMRNQSDIKSISIDFYNNINELWLNFYNDYGEYDDAMPEFKFSSRKDAVEFKKFVIEIFDTTPKYSKYKDEFEAFKKVPINKLYW